MIITNVESKGILEFSQEMQMFRFNDKQRPLNKRFVALKEMTLEEMTKFSEFLNERCKEKYKDKHFTVEDVKSELNSFFNNLNQQQQ